MKRALLSIVVAFLPVIGCSPTQEPADFVLLGGTLVTMNPDGPTAEALAARGQRIVAVGSEREVRSYIGADTEVFDLSGAVAYPGFIDAHAHFLGVGSAAMQLNLRTCGTWSEIVDLVGEAAAKAEPGTWITGRGWHQEKWKETPVPNVEGLPVHESLSAVSPHNPVFLTHASGHAVMVNAEALRLAGIEDGTPDPEGGEIVRDAEGRAVGVLRERAEDLVASVMPSENSIEYFKRRVSAATRECLAKGLTSFQDAGSTLEDVQRLSAMAEAGELDLRLWLMLAQPNDVIAPELAAVKVIGAGEGFLTVRALKRWIDGALGSHGAWLLEPYEDLPSSVGLNTEGLEAMRETARLAAANGFQFCVHAIGDRANRETLDIFEGAFESAGELAGERWRVEHAQHLHPEDVRRFADLGVVASIQPVHCTSDGPWVPQRLGEERSEEGAYVWRDLLEAGVRLVSGTDAPVEDVDPLATFWAAVSREMDTGESFYPAQCMTREEALHSMTLGAAWAAFEEADKGSLEVGKYADVTILSADLLQLPVERRDEATVVATVVGGRVKFQAAEDGS